MSTLLNTLIQDKPLTIDGCTFYLLNGKLACRRARNRKKPRKDRAGKVIIRRSPAQLAVNQRFRGMRRFARIGKRVRERIGAWKIAAAGTGRMGDNLFHSVNNKACEGGRVVDFAEFHFSVGTLSVPRELEVTREGWRVDLRWNDDRRQQVAAPTDRVVVGYFYGALPDSPCVYKGTTASRAEGRCSITVDPPVGRDLHVYVLMEREDGTAYSPDRYFFLSGKEEDEGPLPWDDDDFAPEWFIAEKRAKEEQAHREESEEGTGAPGGEAVRPRVLHDDEIPFPLPVENESIDTGEGPGALLMPPEAPFISNSGTPVKGPNLFLTPPREEREVGDGGDVPPPLALAPVHGDEDRPGGGPVVERLDRHSPLPRKEEDGGDVTGDSFLEVNPGRASPRRGVRVHGPFVVPVDVSFPGGWFPIGSRFYREWGVSGRAINPCNRMEANVFSRSP